LFNERLFIFLLGGDAPKCPTDDVTNGGTTGYAGRIEARYGGYLLPFMVLMRTKDNYGLRDCF